MPSRGPNSFQYVLLKGPPKIRAPDRLAAPGSGTLSETSDIRFVTSYSGGIISHRNPMFTVSFGVIFQSSIAYNPCSGWRKLLVYPTRFWLALLAAPNKKLANASPVCVGKFGRAVCNGLKLNDPALLYDLSVYRYRRQS